MQNRFKKRQNAKMFSKNTRYDEKVRNHDNSNYVGMYMCLCMYGLNTPYFLFQLIFHQTVDTSFIFFPRSFDYLKILSGLVLK